LVVWSAGTSAGPTVFPKVIDKGKLGPHAADEFWQRNVFGDSSCKKIELVSTAIVDGRLNNATRKQLEVNWGLAGTPGNESRN
jgi:hypothetical protein